MIINRCSTSLGSDPELFFVDENNEVVKSIDVLKQAKVSTVRHNHVVTDGFQVELNPYPSFCREIAASDIVYSLKCAAELAKKAGVKLSFALGHVISDRVWDSTDEESRQFGCAPTFSPYEEFRRPDGQDVRLRTGGGHVHISGNSKLTPARINRAVKLMDILCGNTCVLIDRDPLNKERRKYYGRAGEYRSSGERLEYRVPSNFWMQDYRLWSMVSAQVQVAFYLSIDSNKSAANSLLKAVNMEQIREAINNNDYELAMQNFMVVRQWMKDNIFETGGKGIEYSNVDKFLRWAKMKDPLAKLGKSDERSIRARWGRKIKGRINGFERFLNANFK